MSTPAPPAASPTTAAALYADRLVAEIEAFLASQRPTTAHPLVTKTTRELVAEALNTTPAPAASTAPALRPPSRLLRRLPGWALQLPLVRRHFGGAGRPVTVAEHLELTALLIERWGWTQGRERSDDGRLCIEGAQFVLLRLGYGDATTLHQATAHLHQALSTAGGGSFTAWNDTDGRTQAQVLNLLHTAATAAKELI